MPRALLHGGAMQREHPFRGTVIREREIPQERVKHSEWKRPKWPKAVSRTVRAEDCQGSL